MVLIQEATELLRQSEGDGFIQNLSFQAEFMRGSILPVTIPPPPGTPPGKPSPSGPGVGNFLKRSCPGVGGRGKS